MENRDILKISRKSKVGITGSSETLFNFEGPAKETQKRMRDRECGQGTDNRS